VVKPIPGATFKAEDFQPIIGVRDVLFQTVCEVVNAIVGTGGGDTPAEFSYAL